MSRQKQKRIKYFSKAVNDNGLTLIECLVAIAVIGMTTAVIAPVMVFSIATRVQSQKAEQALQVAQGEIEKIRLLVERGGDYSVPLASYPSTSIVSIASTAGPISTAAAFNSTTTNVAKLVNVDSNADNEFAVQVFRSVGSTPTGSPVPIAFDVGVRVYDTRAFQANSTNLATSTASLSFTSGEGQRGSRPLAVIYTSFLKGDRDGSLCNYWRYVRSTPTVSTTGIADCN
ncbi:MAG: type II secretion system protein [Phormidesmis sp. RL_2_1]|nr:type II secretion system protein [Phormidesmis sp. RL_2_1]